MVDHDGLITEHGRYWALAGDDFPGYNAVLLLGWVRAAAAITGREDFMDFYETCLLKKDGPIDCIDRTLESSVTPYSEYMESSMGIYVGNNGCLSNWNNTSMAFISILPLLWCETDPVFKEFYQAVLENHMIRENNFRDVIRQKNAMYNFIYAAMKYMKADGGGPALTAVEDSICQLKQFPPSKAAPDKDLSHENRPANEECIGRLGGSMADTPMEIWQRCPTTFVWWGNPYGWDRCRLDREYIHAGSDYLFAYWMGRYFGFVGDEL